MTNSNLLHDPRSAETAHAAPPWVALPAAVAAHTPDRPRPAPTAVAERPIRRVQTGPASVSTGASAFDAAWAACNTVIRRGLLETAFLPRLTRRAIAHVTAAPQLAEFVERLAEAGCLAQRESGSPPAVRYRPHFRAYLQSMARATLDPGLLTDVLLRTASLLEQELEQLQPAPADRPRIGIRALGGFHILRDGAPLPRHRKAPGKPLMLLKALVALGPASVPSHTLADLLWPDAEGDSADARLTTTLHRARALLGVPEAVLKDCGELALDRRLVSCDVFEFHDLALRLETQQEVDDAAGTQLLEAYPAGLLPACTGEAWLQPCRERLAAKFAAAVARVGRRLDAAGKHCEAQALYLAALAREPTAQCLRRLL